MKLPATSRAYRKNDLFSLLVEVHRARFKRIVQRDTRATALRLQKFFAEVDGVDGSLSVGGETAIMYYRSTVRAAIDRGNRLRRGEILQSLLDTAYVPQLKFTTSVETDSSEEGANVVEGEF